MKTPLQTPPDKPKATPCLRHDSPPAGPAKRRKRRLKSSRPREFPPLFPLLNLVGARVTDCERPRRTPTPLAVAKALSHLLLIGLAKGLKARGLNPKEIARATGASITALWRWERNFSRYGFAGLVPATHRCGRKKFASHPSSDSPPQEHPQ